MDNSNDLVVGIDLGTTNSEIAGLCGERVEVLGQGDARILPSCVALSPDGQLLVGQVARNQMVLYPERTVRSVKRRMGSSEPVTLGERSFTPQEISALILGALAQNAEQQLGRPVRRAVITVPAYFSDSQRQATREAGALAGLEVLRILNEPTAASLAYGYRDTGCVLVYDLGGGTFDVSIVTVEGDVTEVLASHGNNRLGGDDFDRLLLDRVAGEIEEKHNVDLRRDHPAAHARLLWAVQEAKHRLSADPYAAVREEALLTLDGRPIHLEREIARGEYEALIRPLVESTLDSVDRALEDAGKRPADLDAVVLVGGATRTPLVIGLLEQRLGRRPRAEVHPDLCVALGAGVMASRLGGHQVERVLVDVSPYSFGPSYLGTRGGEDYLHCYRPIIHRNTPLPITRTSSYYTAAPFQTAAEISIYQGEDEDALRNILVGEFRIEGLRPVEEPNEILVRMNLDLDGILQVSATEKATGKSREITINGALRTMTEADLAAARARLAEMLEAKGGLETAFATGGGGGEDEVPTVAMAGEEPASGAAVLVNGGDDRDRGLEEVQQLLERARGLLGQMHVEDQQEVIDLNESIENALDTGDPAVLRESVDELKELLFFIEGR